MATIQQLAAMIAAASDAAENESTEVKDVDYDVRESRGSLYLRLREMEDGGRVVWSTAWNGPSLDPMEDARKIVEQEAERREFEAG